MRLALPIENQENRLLPLACNISMLIALSEAAFAETLIELYREICCLGLTSPIESESETRQNYLDIYRAVETESQNAVAWPDCISEWNIRDP
jgi:hypothetical protein